MINRVFVVSTKRKEIRTLWFGFLYSKGFFLEFGRFIWYNVNYHLKKRDDL